MSPLARPTSFQSSFQFKLFLIFSLLTLLLAFPLTILYIYDEVQEKQNFAGERLQLRAEQLAESVRLPLYAENLETLNNVARQALLEPEMIAVAITAPNGRVLADVRHQDAPATARVISKSSEVHARPLISSVDSFLTGNQVKSTSLIGTVSLVRGTADLSRSVVRMALLSTGFSVSFWALVSLFSYLMLRRVTHSFNTLMTGIASMRNGDLAYRIGTISDDEPGRAAAAINDLAQTLQLRSLENSRLLEERLNLERQFLQAQKLESLGVMAGGIAHDFNNLLQSILGNMELAARELAPDSSPQKYISNARNSGKHAANLASMMLTYVGKGFIDRRKLNLNDLVRENVEMLRASATSAVSIGLFLYERLPAIMADEAHIQQLVMNLITNASEAIDRHPGLIRVTTGTQICDEACLAGTLLDNTPEPGSYLFLEVSDSGCGMSEETMKRLFDPFFTTKFTGRGLGMSAVMGIMRAHNGALFVESEQGKGTTFRALFPISESALPATDNHIPLLTKVEVHNNCTLPAKPLSGLALVVDDEKPVLKVCTKMLSLCGFTVITACDGVDAVAKFREHADEIVVVLMDLTMPNMDGITAMNEIHGIRPDAKVILSSGFNKDELSERLTGQPPSGFIRKPYSMNVIETELRRIMLAD